MATDRVQCTRCGKDITCLSKEDSLAHTRRHLMDEIYEEYPELFHNAKAIEAKYGVKLVFNFNK